MSDVPYHLGSMVALAALSSYVGLHHLIISLRRTDLALHRVFAWLAISLGVHNVAFVYRQLNHASDTLLISDRVQSASEVTSLWLMALFVARFTGVSGRRILLWSGIPLLALFAALPLRVGGFAYAEVHGWKDLPLPWGEVQIMVSGTLAPTYFLFIALVAVIFAWCLAAAASAWRRSGDLRQLVLVICLSISLLAVANSVLRDVWDIPTVPVIDHSFVLLCVVMSTVLADEVAQAAALRERLFQAERLESIGRMAGGVAHDFNNLLTGVVGNADLLAVELASQPALRVRAESIAQTGMQAASLARRLRDFSRARPASGSDVDVHAVIIEVVQLLRFGLGRSVAVETALQADRCHVRADAAALTSLFLNLGINARDAMPHGGVLRIATAIGLPTLEQQKRLLLPLEAASGIAITVSDTGEGMDAAVREHLFQPFFSTKGEQGTGLGLVQVAESLRESSGSVLVDSEPGRGTVFRLWLPLAD